MLDNISNSESKSLKRAMRKEFLISLDKVAQEDQHGIFQTFQSSVTNYSTREHALAMRSSGQSMGRDTESLYGLSPAHEDSYVPTEFVAGHLSTRYSPDRPGVQARRVSDGVFQDPYTNRVYDYNEGFTTEDGRNFPGGSAAFQTDLMMLANHLDNRGLVKEADYVDALIKRGEPVTLLSMAIYLFGAKVVYTSLAALAASLAAVAAGIWGKMSDSAKDILAEAGADIEFNSGLSAIDGAWRDLMIHLRKSDLWDGPGEYPAGSPLKAGYLERHLNSGVWTSDVAPWFSSTSWEEIHTQAGFVQEDGTASKAGDWAGNLITESEFEDDLNGGSKDVFGMFLGWDCEGCWVEAMNYLIMMKRLAIVSKSAEKQFEDGEIEQGWE